MGLGFNHFRRINGQYKIHERIGRGISGEVYRVTDPIGIDFAAKFVPARQGAVLRMEIKAMCSSEEPREGATTYWHYFGRHGGKLVLVMDLHGESLRHLHNKYGRLCLKSALLIGIQMTSRLEVLHERGYIHRDIKPEHILFGKQGEDRKCLYLIDYGLARKYRDDNGAHLPITMGRYCYASKDFASIQAHRGEMESRRSDLESIIYVVIHVVKGLPWGRLHVHDLPGAARFKENVTARYLCRGLPAGIERYYSDVMSLAYAERPDYDRLRGYLQSTLRRYRLNRDDEFEWTVQ